MNEQLVWQELLRDRQATPAGVAQRTGLSVEAVQACIDRISSENWREELVAPKPLGGVKFDGDKARYDLIPPEVEEALAQVLTYGAAKYSERNWEKGMRWGRPYAAMRRHMGAWWAGEHNDPETGFSHLWHAACCIAFLVAFEARGTGEDDRPK
jgi:hypothetical protein